MRLTECRDVLLPAFLAASLLASASCVARSASMPEPLVIQEQGSFMAGGTVIAAPGTFDPLKPLEPAGQTFRGDHVYAFYQLPANPRKYPIVMWHGAGQSAKTWETTPDAREGFQNIFLRRRFAIYLIDQPAWHTHPLGQTLIVTASVGRVQHWGGAIQEIRAGDVVWIPPGVKHWHGAAATTGMTHIAISEALDGKTVEWMEHVSDEQYRR